MLRVTNDMMQMKIGMCLASYAPRPDFGGHLEFGTFQFGTVFRTVFRVVPEKIILLRIYFISQTNVTGLDILRPYRYIACIN